MLEGGRGGRVARWREAGAGQQPGRRGLGPQRQRLGADRGQEAEGPQARRVPSDQHAGAEIDHPLGPGDLGGVRWVVVGCSDRQLVPPGPGQQSRCVPSRVHAVDGESRESQASALLVGGPRAGPPVGQRAERLGHPLGCGSPGSRTSHAGSASMDGTR
jgi:hypothetical protein